MNLLDYARDVHSQCGEDGILAELLRLLPNVPHCCVEFGAGDGLENSNTAALIEAGWRGVMIDGDPKEATKCAANYAGNERVTCIQAMVGWGELDSLDALLAPCNMPESFGVLSIDVDGNDWYCWEAVRRYRPRIVVVEINPRIPPFASYVQPRDPAANVGNSIRAMVQLGKVKGYELAAATLLNAIFVSAYDYLILGMADNRPQTLWWNPDYWTWEAHGYDGSLIRGGLQRSMWPAKDGRYAGAIGGR